MPIGEYLPISKERQLYNNRKDKYTQRQKGAISPKVRQEVHERSGGLCEVRIRCKVAVATEQAHDQSRNTIDHRTTANDLLDACNACHRYLDRTAEGIRLRRQIKEMGGASEYIRRRKANEPR